jgi:arylsulfatase A-like enzyme
MSSSRLNLIVLCFDTLRRDALTTDLCRTPAFDRFAAEAVEYTNAWAEGLPTIPFRRAVHTGMRSYPWRRHVGDRGSHPNILGWHAIPEDQTTLAEFLYRRGYATGLISDVWHLFKATMNFVRGFVSWDFVRGQEGDTYTLSAASLQEPSPYGGRRLGPGSYLYQTRDRTQDEDYFVAQVLDRAAEWVEGNRANAPYFLWVDSFTPHEFWDPPTRFADAYYPGEGLLDHIVPQSLNRGPGRPAPRPEDVARTRALYQGYVTFADERLGRFLDRIERAGALRDTVVVLLSDHGTELWDHGQFGKSAPRLHPYNTQINWLVRHPDVRARQTVDTFVQNQDVVPTLLHLLGVAPPPLDGRVVWPWAEGTPPARDHVVIGWDVYASVRDHGWNLLLDVRDPAARPRLYDVVADPNEERDVAAEHPEVVARQLARLESLFGLPLPARFLHAPLPGLAATPGGLREIRRQRAQAGERWEGSNLV